MGCVCWRVSISFPMLILGYPPMFFTTHKLQYKLCEEFWGEIPCNVASVWKAAEDPSRHCRVPAPVADCVHIGWQLPYLFHAMCTCRPRVSRHRKRVSILVDWPRHLPTESVRKTETKRRGMIYRWNCGGKLCILNGCLNAERSRNKWLAATRLTGKTWYKRRARHGHGRCASFCFQLSKLEFSTQKKNDPLHRCRRYRSWICV